MGKIRIECYSKDHFDLIMENALKVNDSNVEDFKDCAFISIIGTDVCLKYYLNEDDTTHYFKDGHENVLNLAFDDLNRDIVHKGHTYKTITLEQAEETVDFIEKCLARGVSKFYVHCRAGVSRSRAVCEMICRMSDGNLDYDDRSDYLPILNRGVLTRLLHAYWKKNGLNGYDDGREYPSEFEIIDVIKEAKDGEELF